MNIAAIGDTARPLLFVWANPVVASGVSGGRVGNAGVVSAGTGFGNRGTTGHTGLGRPSGTADGGIDAAANPGCIAERYRVSWSIKSLRKVTKALAESLSPLRQEAHGADSWI